MPVFDDGVTVGSDMPVFDAGETVRVGAKYIPSILILKTTRFNKKVGCY